MRKIAFWQSFSLGVLRAEQALISSKDKSRDALRSPVAHIGKRQNHVAPIKLRW
jgi:hypothetical protein